MKEKILVCQVQPDMVWEDIGANLDLLNKMLYDLPEGTDLVLFPETFSTGFSMQSEANAEAVNGRAVSWMKEIAKLKKITVSGSVIIRDDDQIYNRLYWISPGGISGQYDKRHLFRMGQENENFKAGISREIFTLGQFRFLPQICYDLRFPVFSRNQGDYDVVYYVANWPAPRQPVWETLVRARAIENQAYALAVNRVGIDGMGVNHLGGTCAIDPVGKVIQRMGDKPGIQSVTIDLQMLRNFRRKFPVWKDADRFDIEL